MLPSTIAVLDGNLSDDDVRQNARALGPEVLNDYFAKHGYKTMAVGKSFHDHVPKKWVDRYDSEKLTLPRYEPDDLDDVPAISREVNIKVRMARALDAIMTKE